MNKSQEMIAVGVGWVVTLGSVCQEGECRFLEGLFYDIIYIGMVIT